MRTTTEQQPRVRPEEVLHPATAPACPVCQGRRHRQILDLPTAPLFCNTLHHTAEDARQAPCGRLQLVLCRGCGLIWNVAFDPAKMAYAPDYENAQHFSPRFRSYLERLAVRLVLEYGICRRQVADIGCGDGLFLQLLCDHGRNEGIGFDPAAPVEGVVSESPRVEIQRQLFSAECLPAGPGLVVCRHVLEHLADPRSLLKSVRDALAGSDGSYVYFETPNTWTALRDLGVWDFLYEHVCYYCPWTLVELFHRCGFGVVEVSESFSDQFVSIIARPAQADEVASSSTSHKRRLADYLAESCSLEYAQTVSYWDKKLRQLHRRGKRTVIWGAGTKGVMFLNSVPAAKGVRFACDVNPRKQGRFVAGTGQRIVAPAELRQIAPDVLLIMNPCYEEEIRAELRRHEVECDLLII